MNVYNWFCVLTTLCSARVSANSNPIVFPDDETTTMPPLPKEIPLDLAMQLSNVTDLEDLMANFIDDDTKPPIVIAARFGAPIERKASKAAKMATCIPENQTVPLTPTNVDPSIFYYPPCTRVARCGGCCSHDLLSCQPVDVEILQFDVVVTEYRGGRSLAYKGRQVVTVEQHKSCKCGCKIKEADCNPYQNYNKEACRCECNNRDKQEKCKDESATKLWNPHECACVCRETLDCPSGFYFDRFTCECVADRSWRGSTSSLDRFNYNVK